jgi:hypothetical protein
MFVPKGSTFAAIAILFCAAGSLPAEEHVSSQRVYTTTGEDAGRNLVIRLERLRTVLQPVLERRDARQSPVCIAAFGSRDEYQPYAPMSRSIGFFLSGARRDFIGMEDRSAVSRTAARPRMSGLTSSGDKTAFDFRRGSTRDWRNYSPTWKTDGRSRAQA